MTIYDFKTIVQKARHIKHSVESTYDYNITTRWCYYICKAIREPGKSFNGFKIAEASKPAGTYISRTVPKADYLDMCRRVIKYVETNKKMPNHVAYKSSYKINIRLFTYIAAYLLVHYVDDRKLKDTVNINTKYFVKPTEPTNVVLDAFIKAFGKVTTFTDALRKVDGKGYGYYFDDVLTNLQVIEGLKNPNGKKPNCVDICHMMWNVAKGLGYDVRCLHVYCPVDDITHVRLQVKHSKYTDGEWENYDPAAVADGDGLYALWCSNGTILAYDPKWFLDNCSR